MIQMVPVVVVIASVIHAVTVDRVTVDLAIVIVDLNHFASLSFFFS